MNISSLIKRIAATVLSIILTLVLLTAKKDSAVIRFIIEDTLPPVAYAEKAVYKDIVEEGSEMFEYILFDDTVTDEYAKKNYYIVSDRTGFKDGDIDINAFNSMDLSVNKDTEGPQVLIFHTHSSEMFADSDISKGLSEGIWGVGEELKKVLENEYGLNVYHDTGRYDYVDGKTSTLGAYERMEPEIKKILEKYPSIELVIDLHRDGLPEGSDKLVTEINGETCAKIMLFNGLTRLNEDGELTDMENLKNPYLKENLALSYRVYKNAEEEFPNLMRKIYIEAYRYSLHMKPMSLLIEVGAQNNTKQEAKNSMKYMAKAIANVVFNE